MSEAQAVSAELRRPVVSTVTAVLVVMAVPVAWAGMEAVRPGVRAATAAMAVTAETLVLAVVPVTAAGRLAPPAPTVPVGLVVPAVTAVRAAVAPSMPTAVPAATAVTAVSVELRVMVVSTAPAATVAMGVWAAPVGHPPWLVVPVTTAVLVVTRATAGPLEVV